MRLLTMSRWSEGIPDDKNDNRIEHFTLTLDTAVAAPVVTIRWVVDNELLGANLKIETFSGGVITGTLNSKIDGSFILTGQLGPIEIRDPNGVFTTPVTEKPKEKVIEMAQVTYEEPLHVNYQYSLDPQEGGFGGLYVFINRIADSGASGLRLTKTVAEGWSLPGVLTPEVATEERLSELLSEEYDAGSTWSNRCYLVGSDVVFFRSTPAGNSAIRASAEDVYDITVSSTIQEIQYTESKLLQQASYAELMPLSEPRGFYETIIEPPAVQFFSDEIRAIFTEAYPEMYSEIAVGLRAYIPPTTQDRPAWKHYSIQRDIHNTVEEENGI